MEVPEEKVKEPERLPGKGNSKALLMALECADLM